MLAVFLLLPGPRAARADGALPDSQSLLTPASSPREIIFVTNFGVVISEDAGATWTWTCEQDANALGFLYQLSPPPRHRVFALANQHLVYSDDLTCTWAQGGGMLATTPVSDFWVDRTVADRVWAVGSTSGTGGKTTYSAFESTNGGQTFDTLRYAAPAGVMITGVETSQSDPQTVYLTLVDPATTPPAASLARSTDGGAHWVVQDLSSSIGAGPLRLIAIDPQDARRVFLLWGAQTVAITPDGGLTGSKLMASPSGAAIRGFQLTAAGTLLVSTSDTSGTYSLQRSTDGGTSFHAVPNAPQIRGFSQRGGAVYAATDNFGDGYALGTSTDDGMTWDKLMSFDQVQAIASCLKASCGATCATEVMIGLWTDAVCSADAPPLATTGSDAGGSDASGGAGGRADGAPDAAPDAPAVTTPASGCACRVGDSPARRPASVGLLITVAALALAARRRARRRS